MNPCIIFKYEDQRGIMLKLRPYQTDVIRIVKDTFKDYFRQYIEMPTGSGKTITFLSYAHQNHNRILIIVPSIQLMNQVHETACLFYHPSEISRKGERHNDQFKRLHICVVHSIRGEYLEKISKEPFDLIIIDEAHHVQSASYERFLKSKSKIFHERDMKVLGVTATPDRNDGKLLKDILSHCSYKISIEQLIEQNFLSDIEGYSIKTNIDLSDIDDHNGDFSLNQLFKKLCTDSRNEMILKICKDEMKNRKTIIFCINIKHSQEINRLLNLKGIASSHIDGTMNNTERQSILSSFRNGEISTLCNCQLLTEGFDEPSIDGIIIARPTKSRALFTQMIGRGLRISPGKINCKIIDIVDNHKNLAGYNCLVEEMKYPEISSFKTIKDIKLHISNEMLKITEFQIERTNLLNTKMINNIKAVPCMIEYLEKNKIYFSHPISFDEASFLIWHNELKEKYHGFNKKET